jgi:hypothetical protein
MSTDPERLQKIESALERTKDKPASEQAAAVAAAYLMTEPSQPTADNLWTWLVRGLIVMMGLALAGLIFLAIEGKSTDVILTAFTTMTSGLLGLFVKSPAK